MNELKSFLEHKAYQMRVSSLQMTTAAGSGHPTSALSAADLVAALFFYAMRYDPKTPANPDNDRFVLSKGHASPILYAAWKEAGVLSEQDLLTYRSFGSVLEGHPTLRFDHSEAATGSLGIGLSVGVGMALSAKMDKRDFRAYVLLGDGECAEGSVWEAAELASYYKLDNVIALMDCNRLGQTGQTMDGHHVERYAAKFKAFGWNTLVLDGHDMQQIMDALDAARNNAGAPLIIIAKTFKGYGVQRAQDKEQFHGKAFSKEELPEILAGMAQQFPQQAAYAGNYQWQPTLPKSTAVAHDRATCGVIEMPQPTYNIGEEIPTRKAYGQALQALGGICNAVVSLDAEVNNSTFAELFAQKYPDRFVQCFIAEQNMVGMAIGFDARGKIPFVSTFACFFSRAHDQVRMAAIGTAKLCLSGSHAGVEIGQDGPSQMGLEDIAMMRALPGAVVLYPSDAVSTHKLVNEMANYKDGISYLRTTRSATPVLYGNDEQFPLGGCKILRQHDNAVACVVGAGITLHQALAAHDQLQKEGIAIAVIDLYSIKPLDAATIVKIAQASGNRVITVEDHYLQGGLGEAVTYAVRNSGINTDCLAVTKLPRSGKSTELLAYEGIDAAAIIAVAKNR